MTIHIMQVTTTDIIEVITMDYMKNPIDENSIMGESFITRFGIKRKTKLSESDLKEALDTYWEKYRIIGKLK